MLELNYILLPVNDFEAAIRVQTPNVTGVEPTHASFIILKIMCIAMKLSRHRLLWGTIIGNVPCRPHLFWPHF
jgi:hypothetical protein